MATIETPFPLNSSKKQTLRALLHPENYVKLTPEDLAELIPAAQKQDAQALEKLCRGFVLLVFDTVKDDFIYQKLGQDSVNMAWEEFLKIIHSYHDNRYDLLPGLIRLLLRVYLLRHIYNAQAQTPPLVSWEELEAQGLDLKEEHAALEEFQEQESFRELLQPLPPAEQRILYESFALGLSLHEQARRHHENYNTIWRSYHKALATLQDQLHGQ